MDSSTADYFKQEEMYSPAQSIGVPSHSKMEDNNMDNAIDGALLGKALADRCHTGHGHGSSHCGETLEGLSRLIHSMDARHDRNADKMCCK